MTHTFFQAEIEHLEKKENGELKEEREKMRGKLKQNITRAKLQEESSEEIQEKKKGWEKVQEEKWN